MPRERDRSSFCVAARSANRLPTISRHITNARSDELAGIPVVAEFATTGTDGKIYQVEHYNLDVVTSVGYRVKSSQGVQFRRAYDSGELKASSLLMEVVDLDGRDRITDYAPPSGGANDRSLVPSPSVLAPELG